MASQREVTSNGSTWLTPGPEDVRFYLILPSLRVGFGVLSKDLIEVLLGKSVEEIVGPMMTGPAVKGPNVKAYPMALPKDRGVSLDFGPMGEIGFFADRGLLRLTVPRTVETSVQERVKSVMAHGPVGQASASGLGQVSVFWLRIPAKSRASLMIPMVGEVGVEGI